jgi:Concanavalin A-like lectin/glucanases superfamily/BNR repeat-like domain
MQVTRREMLNMLAAAAAAEGFAIEPPMALAEQLTSPPPQARSDWRNIVNGSQIPRENYSDQPYVVITKDGNWLCVLTTGNGNEGAPHQHIISTTSSDKGKTWSAPVDIEPSTGPEASWVMPLAVSSGRVYAFYTYNSTNLRLDTKSNSPTYAKRVDTLGQYAMKYSDDYGKTWSAERFDIPMRLMRIDRENAYGGQLLYFWGVGKPISTRHGAMFGFAKVGKWGNPGGMVTSQGCVMHSPNILTETDPRKIQWNLYPDGDEGLHAPKGQVSDETNLVELSDGSLYATYRTIDGHNCAAYSRDAGRTWTPPAYATYTPEGQKIKHPRAANFVKKFSNGKYTLWFHNHGGESVLTGPWDYYNNRNPAWITGGVEKDGHIYWSQPEILLYDMDPKTKISYPDFVEDGGEFYVTETMKTFARVHLIDRPLLEGLWNQAEAKSVCKRGLALTATAEQLRGGANLTLPSLPSLEQGGFTIDFWLRLRELSSGQTILDSRSPSGKGIAITMTDRYTLKLTLNDGTREASWDSDPGFHPGTLKVGAWQYVAFVVDGGPKIITVMVDGVLNDGGPVRDYGWGRFPVELQDVNGQATARVSTGLFGEIKLLRVYDKYLRTSELMGNWRAGAS